MQNNCQSPGFLQALEVDPWRNVAALSQMSIQGLIGNIWGGREHNGWQILSGEANPKHPADGHNSALITMAGTLESSSQISAQNHAEI